jgi:hypothetical protein
VGLFFIDVQEGRVATRTQLEEAGVVSASNADLPPRPWHRVQGPSDASTMWYAVMRKRIRGVFIGMLCIRHTDRQASMEEQGWEEVPVADIGVTA